MWVFPFFARSPGIILMPSLNSLTSRTEHFVAALARD